MKHHQGSSGTWTERTGGATPKTRDIDQQQLSRHGFKPLPHTSLGIAGHIVHMAGVFVPLIAGELVQDAAKYKKTVRLASIGTALAYEGLYVMKEAQRKNEQAAKLADCEGRASNER